MIRKYQIKTNDITKGLFIYACDFETTTAAVSTEKTRVWSFCVDRVGEFKPEIFPDISDFWNFCGDPKRGITKRLYFHNLKFDGEFILYSALHDYGFTTAISETGQMRKDKELIEKEIVYAISDVGQWYFISFVYHGCKVEIRDSLKIMPLPLVKIGKNICTKYKKSAMDYDDKRSLADCSSADIEYIKNDVLVLSEALDKLLMLHDEKTPFGEIHSLTIGGACWQQFKKTWWGENNLIAVHLDKEILPAGAGSLTMDEYIRKGYRGGYCYVNKKYQGEIINSFGFTADVNSLYPYVMLSKKSGYVYPVSRGTYVSGELPENILTDPGKYFYVRVLVSFRIRPGYVPTVQKKNSFMFLSNLYLESSAVYDSKTKQYIGKPQEIELTLAKDDFILFLEHYEIISLKYLDYIVFCTDSQVCDRYIEQMSEIKIQARKEGNEGVATIAKLFSNNLYGQFAKGDNSSFKICKFTDEEIANYVIIEDHNKKVNNIAIGAAVTAHARDYQIRTIQRNIDIFRYSDTDSLHCVGAVNRFKGPIDKTEYGAYDIENIWSRSRFIRQKTYIEESLNGYWTICAAGMTIRQKDYFRKHYNFEDFKEGLSITGGKLQPKRVKGGVILKEVDFTLK